MTVKGYRHRELPDGTWDTICLRCFATVANTVKEECLAQFETTHELVHMATNERVN
jgi:hypothetical protein